MIKYVNGNQVMTVNVEICSDGMGIHYFDTHYNHVIEYHSYPPGFGQQAYKMAKKLETDVYRVANYTNLSLDHIKSIDDGSMK